MEYRSFGRTGVQVSPLCLGCMMFGGNTPDEESVAIIHAAIEGGINFLDTADIYHRGRSETVVGRALKEAGVRERVFLATKSPTAAPGIRYWLYTDAGHCRRNQPNRNDLKTNRPKSHG